MDLLKRSIDQLPDANRDSLSFLIIHLQRVAEQPDNRMTINSLARIFGPTCIGNSTPNQFSNVLVESQKQNRTMEALLSLPTEYWEELLHEPDIYKSKSRALFVFFGFT